MAEGEGLPTRRFIDTSDPEETARLTQMAPKEAPSSDESATKPTSDNTSSEASSLKGAEKSKDTNASKEGQ